MTKLTAEFKDEISSIAAHKRKFASVGGKNKIETTLLQIQHS